MRKLIVIKRGEEVITNRDVTALDSDLAVQKVIDTLKAEYPGDDLQWFKHQCGDTGCTEKAFTPEVKTVPEPIPEPAEKPKQKPRIVEKPKQKPEPKKGDKPAIKRSGSVI